MTTSELTTLFDKFFSDNNGKKIERVDSSSLNQCFDLAIYWMEYLGFPKTVFSGLYGAHEIYDSWSSPLCEKIPNTPDYVPLKGDVVVFSGNLNGGIGHVSVATGKGDTKTFQSFDQNWLLGDPAKLVTHDYTFVLGCQRLKVINSTMDANIKRKSSYTDKILNAVFVPNINTDTFTEKQLDDFIKDLLSWRDRSGKWDKLANKAGYTGSTGELTVQQLFDKVSEKGNAELTTKLAELRAECLSEFKQKAITKLQEIA